MIPDHLISVPFLWGGTTPKGCDCLGLANLLRVEKQRDAVTGFDWVYRKYQALAAMPDQLVIKELEKIGWFMPDHLADLDLLLIRGKYSVGIGTYYKGGILYFPSRISCYVPVDHCATDIIGSYREGKNE